METSIQLPSLLIPMNYNVLLIKTEDQVNLLYREYANANLLFHNRAHVQEVLDATRKIAAYHKLDDRSFFIVCAAACFLHTGYLIANNDRPEHKSAGLAESFLTGLEVSGEDIAEIRRCILATKEPQQPTTLQEKILCDASNFFFGNGEFKTQIKMLRQEQEAITNTKVDRAAWSADVIAKLEAHRYQTDYSQSLLNKTKGDNLARLKRKQEEKLTELGQEETVENTADGLTLPGAPTRNVRRLSKSKKAGTPAKGIETMFKISSTKNMRLSEMADNKAHIMITVNSIIISVVLGLILYKLDTNPQLLIPSIILLIVNATTIFFGVLATRPKFSDGLFNQEQVDNKTVNLLYFGSYYNMNYKEYNDGIKTMMGDTEFLYGTLTKDMFWQGKVLGRKYRLLRYSYTFFMYGILAAILGYLVAIILH
ncbi:MAG: DUF5706 domain-containing protein [Ferruginibacter sp.]|nr:DUF5706 domain-containing protein [Ferruginibacter sp.]